MAVASLDPASGWICGVVGVHPYQLAYADPRVAEDVLGPDHDTWMASPYAPQGVAKPVDGGYIFNGRWQFSSGTDPCDWIFLGAMLGDADGKPIMPPQMLHMILPRKDYEIVEDSWNVVGLRGTGSKDVIVRDAFVPDYRTMDATEVMNGTAQRKAGMTKTLYLMPWSTMFPLGITSAVIGIAEGALAAHLDYQRERVGANGTAIKDDPYVMYAIGEAAADINAARQELLANVDRIYDIVDAGEEVSFADRAAGRRTQVRAAWRAVMAVDQIFSRSGGNALRMDKPLQKGSRFLMTRQALPALIDSGRGVVVNFTSTAASFAHPYMAAYAASKGGVLAFTHSLALEYSKQGLRAVNNQPGGVSTALANSTLDKMPEGTTWGCGPSRHRCCTAKTARYSAIPAGSRP